MHLIPCLVPALVILSPVQAALSGYAPVPAVCPNTPLVRTATGISASESSYIAARAPLASAALGAWLKKVNSTFSTANLPAVALTTSGGGFRSLLTGAGVIQALDSRDSNVGTSGLYQGLTYQAGLSGGGWLLSSFAGNNYPTISNLETTLWTTAFADSLFVPANLDIGDAYAHITVDVLAKNAAGYPPTLVDVYGRLLSYQLLKGADGGVAIELSSITGFSNFTSHNVPFPIITSTNVETATGVCTPPNNTVIYEFSPYEFGSFDAGVNAFTQTKYLGTFLSNGSPINITCETNYDNLGTYTLPLPHLKEAANIPRLHPRHLFRRLQRTLHHIPLRRHRPRHRRQHIRHHSPNAHPNNHGRIRTIPEPLLQIQPLDPRGSPNRTNPRRRRRIPPKQPPLPLTPARPQHRRHPGQRQFRRHERQFPRRQRTLPNVHASPTRGPDQDARHSTLGDISQPRFEPKAHVLRVR